MDISDRIKELRKKTGLSQSKFSAKFGIPVRTLQQWEQGISAPPDYLVRMMAYIMMLEEGNSESNGDKLSPVENEYSRYQEIASVKFL